MQFFWKKKRDFEMKFSFIIAVAFVQFKVVLTFWLKIL